MKKKSLYEGENGCWYLTQRGKGGRREGAWSLNCEFRNNLKQNSEASSKDPAVDCRVSNCDVLASHRRLKGALI